MKKYRLFDLFAVLFIGLIAANFVSAQSEKMVKITNSSGEKRKICMFKADDKIEMFPYRCFEMNSDETILWNREGDSSNFKVKISKPQLIDKYLYKRDLPGDTTVILMGEGGRFGYSRDKPEPEVTKYRLKVCNRQYDQTIYFALGFETNEIIVTEGWWNVEKGKCVEIDVSERLKRQWYVEYGTLPRTFYYARIYGDKPLIWQGGENDYNLCINEKSGFKKIPFKRDNDGKYQTYHPCIADGEALVRFRRLDDPKTNQQYYYLTF